MIYAQKVIRKKMLFALSLSLPSSSSSLFEKTTKTRLLRGGVLLLLLLQKQLSSRENERKEGRKEDDKVSKKRHKKCREIKMSPFFLTKLNKTLNKGVKKVGKKCVHFLYYLD